MLFLSLVGGDITIMYLPALYLLYYISEELQSYLTLYLLQKTAESIISSATIPRRPSEGFQTSIRVSV